MDLNSSTIIESIGVYLPQQSVSTGEVLMGCTKNIKFPLEKITGIKTRQMVGTNEFSIDLAKNAIADCLSKSKYNPKDVDILICCNISRFDGPGMFSFEPNTSIKLRKYFGFNNALVFDITNACAGMFTGIYLVNNLIKTGVIHCGLVVSGESITHLTHAAQKELESYLDNRLACLTLGDSGAAVILEKALDPKTGFQELELQTFGHYSQYCIAKSSEHSGMIMYTDSINLTDVGVKSGASQAIKVLQKARWDPESFQHLIMHQTSSLTLNSAKREINRLLDSKICHEGNTINNLEQRGNTASTSHFIVLADYIFNNHIQSGDKIIFSISASGLTVGTALYVFDDLPERIRRFDSQQSRPSMDIPHTHKNSTPKNTPPRIRIESVGTMPIVPSGKKDSMDLLYGAATSCLNKSTYGCNEIGLLIYTGVYRTDYVLEPAYASLLAGKLNMNAMVPGKEQDQTLAFDIFNGAIGFLNACYLAQTIIASENCKTVMVVAAEIENNSDLYPGELLGIRETASSLILDANSSSGQGFSSFIFRYYPETIQTYSTNFRAWDDIPHLHIEKASNLEEFYIACIIPAVQELLEMEGLDLNRIAMVLPPQISSGFIKKLSKSLDLPSDRLIDVVGKGPDLFSSSIPFAIDHIFDKGLVKAGDIGLIIAVGSGIQVGCAIYHF